MSIPGATGILHGWGDPKIEALSNEKLNYNHALIYATCRTAGMSVLSQLPPVGLTTVLSPDSAHAADVIRKQLDYVDQDRDARETAAAVWRGQWHSTLPGARAGAVGWCHVRGPHRTIELQKVTGIARQFGWVGSDKEAGDTLKTTVGLNSQ